MDGTLVDTEPLWMETETRLVRQFGGSWTHEDAMRLVGSGLLDSARILQDAGVRMAAEDIVSHLTGEVMAAVVRDGVTVRPGARELLAQLRERGVKTALVTMSLRRMALTIVESVAPDAFDVVIAGDDVTRPKPFPDPYLQACEALGVDVRDCVAIEDSPTGLRSAVASGATSLGVPLHVSLVGAGAHAVWPSLDARTVDDLAALHENHRKAHHD
ncbi:hydrolase [Microbacterium mangrovi]|uniref:Hydrolase n=2 Tax=Microbacterium mangrovi TaxID=1348253 RepID=A0A0B2A210_9MICO|nr:hydrolase [Microbacterium mangrovi]